MPHYMIVGQLLDNFDPSPMDEAAIQAINLLNDEIEAAGVRVVVGGRSAPSQAKSLRPQPNGDWTALYRAPSWLATVTVTRQA